MSRITDMTTGNPVKHILTFALPLIITNLGQQFYMIVDAAIVGRGVGVKALAAVGATDWIYWLILWAMIGATQGFSTFVSRFYGDKNYRGVNKTIAMSTILCLFIGAGMTIAGIATARPLLEYLNTPADILDDAVTYLVTLSAGTLIVTAYNMAASVLRAFGDGRSPVIAMIIAALLNSGLDLLFVLVFHWGIFGAAVASVVSQLISFLYCLFRIRQIACIRLDKKAWKMDARLIRALLAFAIPMSLQSVVISLGGIFLQSAVNLEGSNFIAGYTATNKIYGLMESSALSIGLACSTFLSQNYGAKNYTRVRKGVGTATIIILTASLIVMGLTLLFRPELLQLFLDQSQSDGNEALTIGLRYLTIMVLNLPFLYLIHLFRNALQAIGISVWSFISGLAECCSRILMAKIVVHWMGSDALFLSEPMAWFFAAICVVFPYLYYQKKRLPKCE